MNKILNRLGYVTKTEYQQLIDENLELKKDILVLKNKVIRDTTLIDTDIGDPSPRDKEPRAAYVAKVAGFFEEIFEKKLRHMISNTHNLMEQEENTEKQMDKLVGAVFSLRELLLWGRTMLNEHVSYLQKEADISEEEVDELKEKLK